MTVKVNGKGRTHANALVGAGKVDRDSAWSFSGEDGNKLLGANGDDWANYSQWFLAVDDGETEKTKAYYKFPFGKDGKVYRKGVIAAKQRAAQQGYTDVETAASALLAKIDKEKGAGAEEVDDDLPVVALDTEPDYYQPSIHRVWSRLEIKTIEDDPNDCMKIEGIASTPETDRMGDIVEPLGAKFTVPMPLLWQHNAEEPIGLVDWAKPNSKGVPFKATIARAGTTPMIDKARALIKAGLVRGVSIGFRNLKSEPIDGEDSFFGPRRFKEWDWLELSAVTIPANAAASIQSIKSIDQQVLQSRSAALGPQQRDPTSAVRTPGASGQSVTSSTQPSKGKTMTIAEQIAAYEAKRAANLARMNALMDGAAKDGERPLDEAEGQEYDDLESENNAVDKHLSRLRKHQVTQAQSAQPVNVAANGGGGAAAPETDPTRGTHLQANNSRGTGYISPLRPNANLPKGMAFVRYAMLLARAKGNIMLAREFAKDPYIKDSTPEVGTAFEAQYQKATVNPGTSTDATWAGPLVQLMPMASEFIEFLYPMTIIGRIPNFRRVPFNIKMPRQTTTGTSQWVGQGAPKPVGKIDFETVSLGFSKVSTIVVLTDELVRFSNPSAEGICRQDMAEAIARFLDQQFVNPAVTAVANVSPASVTNGAFTQHMTAATIDGVTTDANALLAEFSSHNVDPTGSYWLMNPRTAQAIGTLRTSLGVYAFPTVNLSGGTFQGLPVLTSNNLALTNDSAAQAYAVLVKPSEILLADDGGISVDLSNEASLEMSDSPSGGAQQLVSLWQNNLVGIRAEQYINWLPRRDHVVAVWDQLTL